jgi:hypothetical protein
MRGCSPAGVESGSTPSLPTTTTTTTTTIQNGGNDKIGARTFQILGLYRHINCLNIDSL